MIARKQLYEFLENSQMNDVAALVRVAWPGF